MGGLVLNDQPLAPALATAAAHVAREHPGELLEVLRIVPTLFFPPEDADVADFVAQYNARNNLGMAPRPTGEAARPGLRPVG
ncbi:hypothetical protein ACQKM2_35780 [Streptomyces sp. NPDC004126]|uniref:hypothetical protein n=1 Tax=Streptomyces sp. NPDC004126 TaxID=3390695 RepID=UPI003D08ED99